MFARSVCAPRSVFDFFDDLFHFHSGHFHIGLPAMFVPTKLNVALDPTATKPDGTALFGAGNPGTGWAIEEYRNFEMGVNVHYRQGAQVQPGAIKNGELVYYGPDGAQVVDPAHNVSSAAPNRAAMSTDVSFSTGANGKPGETLEQFLKHGEFIWRIDLDPSKKVKELELHAEYDPILNPGGSHIVWKDDHGNVFKKDDAGNAYTTQNSDNLSFYQAYIDTNPHLPGVQTGGIAPAGTYDMEFQIVDRHRVVTDIDIQLVLT
jgi:hypothetical protein